MAMRKWLLRKGLTLLREWMFGNLSLNTWNQGKDMSRGCRNQRASATKILLNPTELWILKMRITISVCNHTFYPLAFYFMLLWVCCWFWLKAGINEVMLAKAEDSNLPHPPLLISGKTLSVGPSVQGSLYQIQQLCHKSMLYFGNCHWLRFLDVIYITSFSGSCTLLLMTRSVIHRS